MHSRCVPSSLSGSRDFKSKNMDATILEVRPTAKPEFSKLSWNVAQDETMQRVNKMEMTASVTAKTSW